RAVGTHRYHLTPYGVRVVFFYSKLYLRIFRPHAPALEPFRDQIPQPLRRALLELNAAIDRIYQEAALAACKPWFRTWLHTYDIPARRGQDHFAGEVTWMRIHIVTSQSQLCL